MRKYKMQTEKQLMELSCNKCGRKIPLKNGVPQEGVFQGQAVWGYFSEKDGEVHSFDLCEACYDEWIRTFQIPAEVLKSTEIL